MAGARRAADLARLPAGSVSRPCRAEPGVLCPGRIRVLGCDGGRYRGGGSVNGMTRAGLVLIGVPANSSGTVDGVARSPAVLRQRGLAAALARHRGFTDAGDLVLPVPVPVRGPSGLLAEDALAAMIGQVAEAVRAARGRGWFPLLLGGDCPVILGALAAVRAERGRAGLLFADGHEDAWPPRASPTGEAADCELGLALRLFDTGLGPQLRRAAPDRSRRRRRRRPA